MGGAATWTEKVKIARSRALWLVALCIGLACPLACSSAAPGAMNDSTHGGAPTANNCSSPSAGCPCHQSGETAKCGSVAYTSGTYVACSEGTITCDGSTWGACIGDHVTTKLYAAGGLRGQTLGPSQACGSSNVCDPYCNSYVDTPGGLDAGPGLVASDSGLGVSAMTTSNGDTACPGTGNVHSGACNAAPYQTCQQDFHCDTASNSCVWNVPTSYVNPACAGVDLTVGAACNDGTSQNIPLCNRGTGTVASGTTIGIDLLDPAHYNEWNEHGDCPTLAAPDCSITLSAPLGPGQCVDVTSCSWSGDKYAVVNSSAAHVTECAGACANNGAFIKHDGPPGCNACGGGPAQTFTRDFMAVCPAGTTPEWEFFSWQAVVPARSSIAFAAQTAPTQAQLGTATSVNIGTATSTTTTWTSDPNTVAWHLGHDVTPPITSQSWLRVSMVLTPGAGPSPTLTTWQQAYDCLPSQ